ncbi:MAG: hypothetical protein K2Y39_13860 [Candidatus Obscuribacterales bacterium]|nr:hypothetical protein [Candidatus Obscuribacterales bacterium]
MKSFVYPIDEETAKLAERQLLNTPFNVKLRELLVQYYSELKISKITFWFVRLTRGHAVPKIAEYKRRHVLWLIHNAPKNQFAGTAAMRIAPDLDPEGCRLAQKAWKQVLEETSYDVGIIRNAFETFRVLDREYAREILLNAQKQEPNNLEWTYKLMKLHSDGLRNEVPRLFHLSKILFWKWQLQLATAQSGTKELLYCLEKQHECEKELCVLDKQLGLWTSKKQKQLENLEKTIRNLQNK